MKHSKNANLIERLGQFQRIFLVFLFSFVAITAAAQSKAVTVTVTDPYGKPLMAASVVVKGRTNGVIRDLAVNFSMKNVSYNGQWGLLYVRYVPCSC